MISQSTLLARLGKEATIEFEGEQKIVVESHIPILNLMLSGHLTGPKAGLYTGITQIAGLSKTFKSAVCVELAKDFLDKYGDDGLVYLFDCEFGIENIMKSVLKDHQGRYVQDPFRNIEELTQKMVQLINNDAITKDTPLLIIIDSVSMIASKKEIENSLTENSAQDMTRPKSINAFFRQITPLVKLKGIACLIINSTYDTITMYPQRVLKGGNQSMLSSDTVLSVSKTAQKEGKEILGYNFNYETMKSRFVREKSKFSIYADYENGVDKWSGIYELSVEAGILAKAGAYVSVLVDDVGLDAEKKHRRDAIINDDEIMTKIVNHQKMKDHIASLRLYSD